MAILSKLADTFENLYNNINTGLESGLSKSSRSSGLNGKTDLEIDVSCNGKSLRHLNAGSDGDTNYDKRSFIVEGYIYKKGTFKYYGYDAGIGLDGSPEIINNLIGKWACRGWYINKGLDTKTGNYIDTNHTYEFDSQNSLSRILTSNGKEKIDMHDSFSRFLSPGQGSYSKIKGGTVVQTNVGINSSKAFNYTFKFKFRY